MPKISVIVPVYKVEQYLNRCVDSILNQTFEDFELILVDDGSPDNCGKICDEYSEKDRRVHVIHQQNGGLSAARNSGIDWSFENSDSEWLTFVDSDDWIRKDSLELMYNAVTEHNTNLAIAKLYFVDETFKKEDESCSPAEKMEIVKFYNRFNNEINVISACAKLFKKDQWKNIRFPVGKLNEDRFAIHKLIFQNVEASILPVFLYYYRYQNSGSIMNNWSPRRLDDIEAVKEQLKFFKDRNLQYAWEKAVYEHIELLIQFNKKLDKIYPQYKNYRRKLKLELKKVIIKYQLLHAISIKKDTWIFEFAFPKLMHIIWKIHDIIRK